MSGSLHKLYPRNVCVGVSPAKPWIHPPPGTFKMPDKSTEADPLRVPALTECRVLSPYKPLPPVIPLPPSGPFEWNYSKTNGRHGGEGITGQVDAVYYKQRIKDEELEAVTNGKFNADRMAYEARCREWEITQRRESIKWLQNRIQ